MKIIAHRGWHEHEYENTFEAITAAVDVADGVEFDIQLTRCGVPVVFHDDTLERTHQIRRSISQYSYKELKEMKFSPDCDANVVYEIPTLARVLGALPRDFLVNIELKAPQVKLRSIGRLVGNLLCGEHRELLISSFNPLELLRFLSVTRHFRIGLLTDPQTHEFLAGGSAAHILRQVRLDSIHPHFSQVTLELVSKYHQKSCLVFPWTVNDEVEISRQLTLGVDGVITDKPVASKHMISDIGYYG